MGAAEAEGDCDVVDAYLTGNALTRGRLEASKGLDLADTGRGASPDEVRAAFNAARRATTRCSFAVFCSMLRTGRWSPAEAKHFSAFSSATKATRGIPARQLLSSNVHLLRTHEIRSWTMSRSLIRRVCRQSSIRGYHFDSLASTLPNTVNTADPDFLDNSSKMDTLVKGLKDLYRNQVEPGGSDKARKKHLAQGKMLPRQRLDRLLDPGSPFLELSQHAGHELYKDPLPAGALITGIGTVSG
jgi:hypothetical protein